jgi:uncharacterized protein YjbI with pentapeptide repeats/cell division protein FtsB
VQNLLRRKVIRALSAILSAFFAILAFLKWETSIEAIPGSMDEQATKLLAVLGNGWAPVIALFLLSVAMFGLWLGPDRLQEWKRVYSDWRRADVREIERLQAENEWLRSQVEQADQSEGTDSTVRAEWRRRFDAEVRQAFLNRYKDEAKALRAENERLKAERDELEEGADRREAESQRELEAQGQQGDQDALERYLDRMEQWVLDEQNPLASLSHDHPRRKMAATRTREILRRLNPKQKRDVLVFLYEHGLIKKNGLRVVGLKDADFSGADLRRVQVWDANLDGVNLSEADLSGASMCGFHGHSASMQAAIARGSTDWQDSMIPDRSTSFLGADFSGAVLKRIRLAGCHVISADFAGADLEEADLRGADLRLARNLTQEQLESAFGSSGEQEYMPDTLLPDDLTVPEAWENLISQQIEDRGY